MSYVPQETFIDTVKETRRKTHESFDSGKLTSNTLQFLPVFNAPAVQPADPGNGGLYLPQQTSHVALQRGLEEVERHVQQVLRDRSAS